MKYLVVVAFFVLCSPAFADQIEVSFGPIPATEYNFLPGPPVSGTLLLTIGLPQYTGDWAMFGSRRNWRSRWPSRAVDRGRIRERFGRLPVTRQHDAAEHV
jgi:hypothetical protein